MELIEASYFMQRCDYSFGAISSRNPKLIGLNNYEFITKCNEIILSGKEYMTLFVDNIRLYSRNVEYTNMEMPGVQNWDVHRTNKNSLVGSLRDQDLLKTCSLIPEIKFIIFSSLDDTPVDSKIFENVPNNVLRIFAANSSKVLNFDGVVSPMPFGLTYRGYNDGLNVLGDIDNRIDALIYTIDLNIYAKNKMYINYSVGSNPERSLINDFFVDEKWATISSPKSISPNDYREYLISIKNHKFVLCPDGNAIDCDCYRNWETLYMRRVPIVKRSKYMELIHYGFPVLFVDSFFDITEELLDSNEHLYEEAISMDMSMLDVVSLYDGYIKDALDKSIYNK